MKADSQQRLLMKPKAWLLAGDSRMKIIEAKG